MALISSILEHASCEKMRALGVELLKQSVPVIEALEERFAGLANGLFLLNKVYTTLYSAPSSITIDLTSGRTDIYKTWRERNWSGTYHFRGIHDERPVYKVYFYYKHKIISAESSAMRKSKMVATLICILLTTVVGY